MTLFATLISAIVSWSDRVKSRPVSEDGRLSRSMSGAVDKMAAGQSDRTSLFGSARIHLGPRRPFGRRRKIVPLRLPVAPDCVRFDLNQRGTRCTNVESSPWPDPPERVSSRTGLPNVQRYSVVHSSADGSRHQSSLDKQGKFGTGDRRDSSGLSLGENGFASMSGGNIAPECRSSFAASAAGSSNLIYILASPPPTHAYPGWAGAGRER